MLNHTQTVKYGVSQAASCHQSAQSRCTMQGRRTSARPCPRVTVSWPACQRVGGGCSAGGDDDFPTRWTLIAPARSEEGDRERRHHCPGRILQRVVKVVARQHRDPRQHLRAGDQRHDHPPGAHRPGLAHQQGPLRDEGELGHGGDRPADEDARDPGLVQAEARHVDHRQHRAEAAADDVERREPEQAPSRERHVSGKEVLLAREPARRIDPRGGIEEGRCAQRGPPG